ncbi:DedA family protein [Micromonospora zamorensis]|uniref:DedA family protein n=1 Tax=Micromonospora zamorensis TaxID=709883 RepID=UPI003F4CCDD8
MIRTSHAVFATGTPTAAAEPPQDGMVGYVSDLVERLGGPGAGLAVALENLFPPIPSEVILPLAGFVAAQGRISLIGAIFWTTLGSVVGALALYLIGASLGRDRMRAIVARLPLVKLTDVDRTEAWFLRHGVKAVFFGRMIPIFRSLISIPAGVERMPVATFLLYTTLGSLIWNTTFVLAGYLLGDNWHLVEGYVGVLQNVVIVACVAGLAWFVGSRVLRARRAARNPEADDLDSDRSVGVPGGVGSGGGFDSDGGFGADGGFGTGGLGADGGFGVDRGVGAGGGVPDPGGRGTLYRSGSWGSNQR